MAAQKPTKSAVTAKSPNETTDQAALFDDFESLRNLLAAAGPLTDAAVFNATFPDPGTGDGLPDLAEPGETIRDKPVFGLTEDWDDTREGDNNVRTQIDSGMYQDVSDGVITYAFFDHQTRSASTTTQALARAGVTRRSRRRSAKRHGSPSTTGTS